VIRDYEKAAKLRVNWIKEILEESGAKGIVFASSGGKDAVLTGILCKMACENTLGVILPCESKRNFTEDKDDALLFAEHFDIEHIIIDITKTKAELVNAIGDKAGKIDNVNIAPRLRMTTVYAIANGRGALVAGTGNRSETYMGYFTKWGDGAYDFNPIADLTVTEICEFLQHLGAPEVFWTKAPSAGLYEGQTDELEMGVSYAEIDKYLLEGEKGPNFHIIERYHKASEHKRLPVKKYGM